MVAPKIVRKHVAYWRERPLPGKFRGDIDRQLLADSVEKLRFQSYPKNFEAVEASLPLGRGGTICSSVARD
jgi:hypothetical protein